MKNWDPPLLGAPVFAIDRVNGSLLSLGHPGYSKKISRHSNQLMQMHHINTKYLSELIWNTSLTISGDHALTRNIECGPSFWTSSTRLGALSISAMRASKLIHEVLDNSVEVKVVIEAFLCKVDEVICTDWHLLSIQLDGKVTHGGLNISKFRHGRIALSSKVKGRRS
jgi:hypothetical protein